MTFLSFTSQTQMAEGDFYLGFNSRKTDFVGVHIWILCILEQFLCRDGLLKEFLVFSVGGELHTARLLGDQGGGVEIRQAARSPVFNQAIQDWLCEATPRTCVCELWLSANESPLALRAR